ncbi:hypothetical protein V1478_002872 [Vespula squamosa]|uniref:Uncharacterized protein n=1 Tax=Vespula squamosa TaxID=30214 RepID=A0ABD2BR31_VESSQ
MSTTIKRRKTWYNKTEAGNKVQFFDFDLNNFEFHPKEKDVDKLLCAHKYRTCVEEFVPFSKDILCTIFPLRDVTLRLARKSKTRSRWDNIEIIECRMMEGLH